jgi:exopolyphosphatase/guanosine-5'-triphosphate,3'-diphosphate pyrophosphatase
MLNSVAKESTVSISTATAKQDRILAAIDIGTNSIHMVVVRVDPVLPTFTIIAKEKDTVRLGDRDPRTGDLTPEAMERATRGFAALSETRKKLQC